MVPNMRKPGRPPKYKNKNEAEEARRKYMREYMRDWRAKQRRK